MLTSIREQQRQQEQQQKAVTGVRSELLQVTVLDSTRSKKLARSCLVAAVTKQEEKA